MKVGFFTLIKWAFAIRDEINAAFKDDKQMSAKEMIIIFKNLSEVIKLPLDPKLQQKVDLISEVADELEIVVADNKVTIQEVVNISQIVCDKLGYDLDAKGFNIPEIKKKED